jgi:hypothetical protein
LEDIPKKLKNLKKEVISLAFFIISNILSFIGGFVGFIVYYKTRLSMEDEINDEDSNK